MPKLAQLAVIVDAELHGRATKTEGEWLKSPAMLPLWYGELWRLMKVTETAIFQKKSDLKMKRLSGVSGEEYLEAKRVFTEWHQRALYFFDLVKRRRETVGALIKIHGLDISSPLLVEVLHAIKDILEEHNSTDSERIEHLRKYINNRIKEWEKS